MVLYHSFDPDSDCEEGLAGVFDFLFLHGLCLHHGLHLLDQGIWDVLLFVNQEHLLELLWVRKQLLLCGFEVALRIGLSFLWVIGLLWLWDVHHEATYLEALYHSQRWSLDDSEVVEVFDIYFIYLLHCLFQCGKCLSQIIIRVFFDFKHFRFLDRRLRFLFRHHQLDFVRLDRLRLNDLLGLLHFDLSALEIGLLLLEHLA
mmetsp:Transcript_21563/g.15749  ORF Transcript_21563/g.15749 Transcript_21563/m.15749 type:complete len:202 (+) Transcript_21563:1187-1792(+)